MRHEMLTQRALFCHRANTKRGTLSQHFVTHVVPPRDRLSSPCLKRGRGYVLTYDLYTWKIFRAEFSAAVLKLSHEL